MPYFTRNEHTEPALHHALSTVRVQKRTFVGDQKLWREMRTCFFNYKSAIRGASPIHRYGLREDKIVHWDWETSVDPSPDTQCDSH